MTGASDVTVAATWQPAGAAQPLANGTVHVWRIELDRPADVPRLRPLLSGEETARADRFYHERDRIRFTIAHGEMRRILSRYAGVDARAMGFRVEEFGKPFLLPPHERVQFNLAHSGALALVAVSADVPVGVDVERWDRDVEHLELAERFFSPVERRALNALVERDEVVPGFFACWTRKEAYLKATGLGITRGLDYFDVSLDPRDDARLIADRLEPGAVKRWTMKALAVRDKYSAAVVADASTTRVELFDTPALS